MDEIEDLAAEDKSVADLFGEIMGELRLLSTLYMKSHPPEVTLQPTIIVSEAFVRLANHRPEEFKSEDDFRATASVILRQVFAERAKKRIEEKRRAAAVMQERRAQKGAADPVVEAQLPSFEGASPELTLALENALEMLSEVDDRSARVAELKIFGSLPMLTISTIVGGTLQSAEKDWRFAKAFLQKHLKDRGDIS
ncbi:MAG: ECF-type sigma factor [Planctomycetota bacterium]|nr:ECF-type sigma factor [Planctomycetota bacterium]